MATRITHQLIDDLDGTIIEDGAGGTFQFSLDGRDYDIDLTDEHAGELVAALAPFQRAGRKLKRTVGRRSAR